MGVLVPVETQAYIWDCRFSGMTIEDTAFEVSVAHDLPLTIHHVKKYGPKAVDHHTRGPRSESFANPASTSPSTAYLEPCGSLPTVGHFRRLR